MAEYLFEGKTPLISGERTWDFTCSNKQVFNITYGAVMVENPIRGILCSL